MCICEVCWLGRGKVLQRFLSLVEEMKDLLKMDNQSVIIEVASWLCDLAFLTKHL
jgi:hypothetical protein